MFVIQLVALFIMVAIIAYSGVNIALYLMGIICAVVVVATSIFMYLE